MPMPCVCSSPATPTPASSARVSHHGDGRADRQGAGLPRLHFAMYWRIQIAAADIVDDVRAIARQICWPRLRWNERAIRLLRITEQQSAASVVRQRNDRLGEFRFMHVIAEIEPFLDFK